MPTRPFSADAAIAHATATAAPRGIAFYLGTRDGRSSNLRDARRTVKPVLPGWEVHRIAEVEGWFEAAPPAGTPYPLGEFWDRLRALREAPDVERAEPLLLVASPDASATLGFVQDELGLWGWPYDEQTREVIAAKRRDPTWHHDQLKIAAAHQRWLDRHPGALPGNGVIVAHPDTGYTDHPELEGRWRKPGRSFLVDGNDALDDLMPGRFSAPGHGTATASVIASGSSESDGTWVEVSGIAPGVQVVPLRVSQSVIHIDFENLSRAIAHATTIDADVISMSLGGPFKDEFLRTCIAEAHARGIIVVSAAGNMVPTVVYPAAFPEVVAVAATHAAGEPWRHSGLGSPVDIAAPGEDVWCARSTLGESGPVFGSDHGTGTSYATACVAGIAALWLSFHGGRREIASTYGDELSLVPLAFHYLLAKTANMKPDFVRRGRHGRGIADADALLEASLPDREEVQRFREVLEAQSVHALSTITGLFTGWLGVTEDPATHRPSIDLALDATLAGGRVRTGDPEETDAVRRAKRDAERETALLRRFLGGDVAGLRDELLARITADRQLLVGVQRWRPGESLTPFFLRLLERDADRLLSVRLRDRLRQQVQVEQERDRPLYQGRLDPPDVAKRYSDAPVGGPDSPTFRMLRAYAFDPSQATMLDTAPISQVTIPVRWEQLLPGPIGEYLEVVDVDPASGCAYAPVDLNHPHALAQDGLAPSEGNPQFHQQMVYAVAMATIGHFELALGRPVFWASIRPWLREQTEERFHFTSRELRDGDGRRDRFVQRLRIYPHALREANAHYSPAKRALLFGYFPASDDATGKHYPGGMVFTCLSHDIVVHETTHALMDGMHPYFNEPGAGDMWAFHEAFADIIALFQHFTYPEVIRHQIARTRGDLETNNLLAQLAQQFGQAASGRHALRDALGELDAQGTWKRRQPDPLALASTHEPHARGSILVAAVFDAFLALYNDRIADLLRISTGGSGVVPAGQLHPDLIDRLADTAASTASEVLRTCIRATDYLPPVDVLFGEFLRALITADHDLSAGRRWVRIAFIEAFRSWGIYPQDITALSEESLMWSAPQPGNPIHNLRDGNPEAFRKREDTLASLRLLLDHWQPGRSRKELFDGILDAQASVHGLLRDIHAALPAHELLPGLDLRDGANFSVSNMRLARRTGALGEFRNEMIFEVVQSHAPPEGRSAATLPRRGGATIVIDLSTWDVRYIIYKRLYSRLPATPGDGTGELARRLLRRDIEQVNQLAGRPRATWQGEDAESPLVRLARAYGVLQADGEEATVAMRREPFRFLHHSYFGDPDEPAGGTP